jgi:hypothetical protein
MADGRDCDWLLPPDQQTTGAVIGNDAGVLEVGPGTAVRVWLDGRNGVQSDPNEGILDDSHRFLVVVLHFVHMDGDVDCDDDSDCDCGSDCAADCGGRASG